MKSDMNKLGACVVGHLIYAASFKTCQVYNTLRNRWHLTFNLPCECYAISMVQVKLRWVYGVAQDFQILKLDTLKGWQIIYLQM